MNQNQNQSSLAKLQAADVKQTETPKPPMDIKERTEMLKQIADPNCPEPTRAALIKQLQAL